MTAQTLTLRSLRKFRGPGQLVIAALALRALIPLGYMPGNLFAGEYMVLCPTGMPQQVVAGLHHQHHADQDAGNAAADQSCPIGTALQHIAVPAADFPQVIPVAAAAIIAATSVSLTEPDFFRYYLSRAPPR